MQGGHIEQFATECRIADPFFAEFLVSGEEDLKGFGTYDVTSSYPVYNKKGGQTGKKSYKYKESVPVDFGNGVKTF